MRNAAPRGFLVWHSWILHRCCKFSRTKTFLSPTDLLVVYPHKSLTNSACSDLDFLEKLRCKEHTRSFRTASPKLPRPARLRQGSLRH
jgi:hypothetical protein